jgi:hypothetical protein
MDGIKVLWFYLFNLIDSVCRNKTLCLGDPNLTTINDTKSHVKGNIVGKHIMLISQEEGCDI